MNSNYILLSDGSFISTDELYHHGVLGMKWGVRRYQNKDGTLTAAGRKRYRLQDAKDANEYYKNARTKADKALMDAINTEAPIGSKVLDRYVNEVLDGDYFKYTASDITEFNKWAEKNVPKKSKYWELNAKVDATADQYHKMDRAVEATSRYLEYLQLTPLERLLTRKPGNTEMAKQYIEEYKTRKLSNP